MDLLNINQWAKSFHEGTLGLFGSQEAANEAKVFAVDAATITLIAYAAVKVISGLSIGPGGIALVAGSLLLRVVAEKSLTYTTFSKAKDTVERLGAAVVKSVDKAVTAVGDLVDKVRGRTPTGQSNENEIELKMISNTPFLRAGSVTLLYISPGMNRGLDKLASYL